MKCWSSISVIAMSLWLNAGVAIANGLIVSSETIESVVAHGPWPPEVSPDPSNRLSGDPRAIELGRVLFNSSALSRDENMSCASCHQAINDFSDALPRAQGIVMLDRNTPSLNNTRFNRWFSWGGGADNLWAQSLLPIVNPKEFAQEVAAVRGIVDHPDFKTPFEQLIGTTAILSDNDILVGVAKTLAAYQETLVTGRTTFDEFRDAVAAQNWDVAAKYPIDAQRGLELFEGKGRCSLCHSGPLFTNGEFHDAGVAYFIEPGRVDRGRHGGIEELKSSDFTLDGVYSDDPEKSGAWAVRRVVQQHSNFGSFRVPGLRNVAKTAPYMHNGSLATLADVVRHYSEIDMERLHADGESILMPLNLSDAEISDLVAFLKTLSDE